MEQVRFILGDKLPLSHDVVTGIISFAPGGKPGKETKKRTEAINCYTTAIISQWIKTFGEDHVQTRKTVARKIRLALKNYHSKVINVSKSCIMTRRERQRKWREENMELFDILRPTSDPNNFENDEKLFYEDQKSARSFFISERIDEDYMNERLSIVSDHLIEGERVSSELEYIEIDQDSSTGEQSQSGASASDLLNQSINRSGLSRSTKLMEDKCIQTEQHGPEQPEIRKIRKCSDDIKRACTSVSVGCGLSVEKSRIAVQIAAKELYHHEYRLEPEEDPQSPPAKRQKGLPTVTKDECEKYKNTIPSRRTLVKYKHLQSTQSEREAALALYNKPTDVKVTLHYDTHDLKEVDRW